MRRLRLETTRLVLRPFRLRDARRFVELAGDLEVARMTSDIPHPLYTWQSLRWLKSMPDEVRFAIDHHGHLIGGVGFFCPEPDVGELGFWLGRPHWGRGLATEAASAVVSHAFQDCGIRALTSAHFTDNTASGHVMDKLGFAMTGRVRTLCRARGREVEAVTWRLDHAAWSRHADPRLGIGHFACGAVAFRR